MVHHYQHQSLHIITKMQHLQIAIIILSLIGLSQALYCYNCESSTDFTCSEFWDPTEDVNEKYYSDCEDVHDSKYCVKMTGVYDGKLGTKRFCSSRDWGSYCEYIKRPGDPREYRSCVFTCTTHGCNGANAISNSCFAMASFIALVISGVF